MYGQFTCTMQPCLNDYIIEGDSVYNLSKTTRVKISIVPTRRDLLQTNFGMNRCKTDIAKPVQKFRFPKNVSNSMGARLLPLFLDHFQKIAMIHNTLKDGPKGKAIMPTESCREPYDRNFV